MQEQVNVVCGRGAYAVKRPSKERVLGLALDGQGANVKLEIDALAESLVSSIEPEFIDLIEIATYVYVADQAIKRGTYKLDDMQADWRRNLVFHIPVRKPEVWKGALAKELVQTLSFLSDDHYEFEFREFMKPPGAQGYFHLPDVDGGGDLSSVSLFSGGLDSLAGALTEVARPGRPCFVTHLPSHKLNKRLNILRSQVDLVAKSRPPLHITVEVNKAEELTKEYTQRTRSFLFASLAATVATVAGLSAIKFYENGVISINLPISGDMLGARATRTTHPQVLAGFARLFTLLRSRGRFGVMQVESPFLWLTKGDVVRAIDAMGGGHMIASSTSCTHSWTWSYEHTHCGTCSQCIDRRIASLATELEHLDSLAHYKLDPFFCSRPKSERRSLIAAYIETARSLKDMDRPTFIERFPQVLRVARQLPGEASENVQRIYDLFRRHGAEVSRAIEREGIRAMPMMIAHTLPPNTIVEMATNPSIPSDGFVSVAHEHGEREEEWNIFRDQGKDFQVKFNGGRLWLLDKVSGARFLRQLLLRPGARVSATDLVLQDSAMPQQFAWSRGQEIIPEDRLIELNERVDNLKMEMEEALAAGNQVLHDRLTQERGELLQSIRKVAFKGKRKRMGDDRDRHRKQVVMAFTRLLERVQDADKAFAAHLATHLKSGNTCVYAPNPPVAWVT